MYEAIPVGAGIILAFLVSRVADTRLRATIIAVVSVVVGVTVAVIAAEARIFILFDVFQVAFACIVGMMILKRVRSSANA